MNPFYPYVYVENQIACAFISTKFTFSGYFSNTAVNKTDVGLLFFYYHIYLQLKSAEVPHGEKNINLNQFTSTI